MDLKEFLHAAGVGFARLLGKGMPRTTAVKQYGSAGEDSLVQALRRELPGCRVKQNVLVQTGEGKAEIDCMVLYGSKVFAVEVKRWKGELCEQNGQILQKKRDRWTFEVHKKLHRSPFKQLNRAVWLLRRQIPVSAWVNGVVFFDGAKRVTAEPGHIYFEDAAALAQYIRTEGRPSGAAAEAFFDRCVQADVLASPRRRISLQCLVCDDSLRFETDRGLLTRRDIAEIRIRHRWARDELYITTVDGATARAEAENRTITVQDNGRLYTYSLCKLEQIRLGMQ